MNGFPQINVKDASGQVVAINTAPPAAVSVARKVAAGSSSASVTLTADCRRISIFARLADSRFEIGSGGVIATQNSAFIAAGERIEVTINEGSSIAAIRDAGWSMDGFLEITELVEVPNSVPAA